MTSPWRYFRLDEVACHCPDCNSTGEEMDTNFMRKVEGMRLEAAFPFIVTSAYRCKAHNKAVGGVDNSAHVLGKGMDISTQSDGFNMYRFIELACKYSMTCIIIYEKHIHIDNCTNKEIASRPYFGIVRGK